MESTTLPKRKTLKRPIARWNAGADFDTDEEIITSNSSTIKKQNAIFNVNKLICFVGSDACSVPDLPLVEVLTEVKARKQQQDATGNKIEEKLRRKRSSKKG